MLINRPAHNSGLAKAAIEICAKIEHPLGSLRQATKRYKQAATFRFQTSYVAHNLF